MLSGGGAGTFTGTAAGGRGWTGGGFSTFGGGRRWWRRRWRWGMEDIHLLLLLAVVLVVRLELRLVDVIADQQVEQHRQADGDGESARGVLLPPRQIEGIVRRVGYVEIGHDFLPPTPERSSPTRATL